MKELTPLNSLSFFEQHRPEFLSTDTEIKTLIEDLRNILKDEQSRGFDADLLSSGKNFIKHIISKSIECLSDESNSPKKHSEETIDKYIETFTVFEEMLFGLDENYRDHTLHSLWVYLFGHEFITCIGGYEAIRIAGQMSVIYPKDRLEFVLWTDPQEGQRTHMEAMWGMISILHDLGYPIQNIIETPHEVFRNILDPFAIDFNSIFQIDLGSRITLLHQSVCDLLSTTYRPEGITPQEENKYFVEAAENGKRHYVHRRPTTSKDEGVEMEFRIASVNKAHSAWSSILAFKNIAYLHEGTYHGGGSRDYLKLLTQRDILYSILHHTSEEPNDVAVNHFQFVLLLMDDIEETIRYSRGGKLRGVKSTNCEVQWEVDEDKASIKLDYTKYENKAEPKYKDMENKYKAQISRKNVERRPYVIEIKIIGNQFKDTLKLHLSEDKEEMGTSEPTPSAAAPYTDT
jgi:uncharacterized protein (UPF0335 family)